MTFRIASLSKSFKTGEGRKKSCYIVRLEFLVSAILASYLNVSLSGTSAASAALEVPAGPSPVVGSAHFVTCSGRFRRPRTLAEATIPEN